MSEAAITADTGAGEADAGTAAAVAAAGESTAGASWREGLPVETRDHPALADFADVPALAKSHIETKEMVGRKGIILPKEGDAADLARFNKEIGVPETAEDYDMSGFTPPEGLQWSDGFQTAMLAKLHARGVPSGQVRGLFDDYAEVRAAEQAAMQAAEGKGNERGTLALKEELGADYPASTALAERAFRAASGDQFEELSHLTLADGTNLGDNPAFVRTFINVGKQYQEHGLAGEKVGGGGFMKTPAQAKDEIATLENNPAYHDADNPEHNMVVAKMNDLYKQAYPEKAPEVLE